MDDSLFLPKDILEIQNNDKCFSDLRRSILNLGRVVSTSVETQDITPFLELERDLVKKLDNLKRSLNFPSYTYADDLDVEFVSNMTIPVNNLLDEIHSLLIHKLAESTLCFDKRYYFGTTRNLSRYIVSSYNLSSEDLDSLISKGSLFIYDEQQDELFIFDKPLIHTALKHLLFKGEDVELFYILKKLQNLLK